MNPNANTPNPGIGRRAQTLLTLQTTLDQARALAKSYVDNGYPVEDSPTDFIIQYILAKLPSGNQNCTQFLADLYAGVGALLARLTAPPAPRDPAQAEIFAPHQENPLAPSATTPHETEAPKQPLERFVCGIIECYPSNENRTSFPSNSEFRRLSQANRSAGSRPSRSLSQDNHHDLLTFDALSSPLSQYTLYSVDIHSWTLAPLDRTLLIPNDYLVILIPNHIDDEDRDRIDEITALQEFWKARNDMSYKFIRLPSLPPPSRKRSRSTDSAYDSDSSSSKRQKSSFKGTPFIAAVVRTLPHDLNPDSVHHAPVLAPALRTPAGGGGGGGAPRYQRRQLTREHAFYGFSHPEVFGGPFSEHQNAHMLYTYDPLPAPIDQYDIYDVHQGLWTLQPLNRYPLVANRDDRLVVLVDRRVGEEERDRRGELRAADDVWNEWDGRKGCDQFVEMRLPALPDDPALANVQGQTVLLRTLSAPKEEEEKEDDGNAVAGPSKPRERKTRTRKNQNQSRVVAKDDDDDDVPSPVGKGKKRAREEHVDQDTKGKKRARDSDDDEEVERMVQPKPSPPKKARKGRKKPVQPVQQEEVDEASKPKRRSNRIAQKK